LNIASVKQSIRKYLFFALLALTPATYAADRARIQEVGEGLMCICGCNQILSACNHLGCPNSQPMLREVGRYLDEGMTAEQIHAAFVEKYGVKVLSAPPVSGAFNISAWLMPFAVLIAGSFLVVYFLRSWKAAAAPADEAPADPRYQQKIEDELRKFTPED
jgi:cytochrome c-type biogenesis protein CcmH